MSLILNFKPLYADEKYNRDKNPDMLNVKQLSPIGVSWQEDKTVHQIIDKENKVFSEKFDDSHLVIIKAPFEQDVEKNNCYLFNVKAEIVIDFRKLIENKIDNKFYYFYDIYKDGTGDVLFLINHKNRDFKFKYNLNKNAIEDFVEVKW